MNRRKFYYTILTFSSSSRAVDGDHDPKSADTHRRIDILSIQMVRITRKKKATSLPAV